MPHSSRDMDLILASGAVSAEFTHFHNVFFSGLGKQKVGQLLCCSVHKSDPQASICVF